MKKSVLRKVMAVALSATVLCGTGFTTIGQFVGTDVSVSAAEVYGDFEYEMIDDNTVAITGYTGNGGMVVIPDTIDNKNVTSIGYRAFYGCKGLTSVVIPDSVTYICGEAFRYCTGLKSIEIPDSVTSIGQNSFRNCTGLTSVTIGNNVTSIKDSAFYDCASLTSVVIPNSVTGIGRRAFGYYYYNSKATKIDNFTIYGTKNSAAETYANNNNIPFVTLTNHIEQVVPTCTENGKKDYYHNDVDGKNYEDADCEKEIEDLDSWGNVPATGHNYKEEVIAPTATEQGYTLHTCINCGDSYKDNYTAKLLVNNSILSAEAIQLGEKITVTGKATGGTGEYLYKVLYKQKTQSNWKTAQTYQTNSTVTFKPTNATIYDVCVKVKDSSNKEVEKSFEVTVKQTVPLENISVLSSLNIDLGEYVKINCSATGGVGEYKYQVVYKQETQSTWTTAQPYSTTNSVSIKPAKAVTYDVCVKVKDSANTEVKNFYKVTVTDNRPKNLSTISSSSVELGDTVVVKAKASGSTGFFQYAVYYKKASDTKWICRQSFKAKSVITFAPSFAEPYDVCVKVKDDKGTVVKKYFNVDVIKPQDKLINASAISANDIKLGERITVFSSASGSTGFYQYAVSYRNSNNTNWITIQDYSSEDIVQVKPDSIGTYEICVKVKDNQNNVIEKYFTVTVK